MTTPPAAGWYPDPKMTGTQRYWDGAKWSDHVAPLAPRNVKADFDGWKVLRWSALGVLAAFALIWVLYTVAHSNDDLDCASRNADHALNNEPMEDCGS